MSALPPLVLLLAYYFPPATGIASERMVGFHRHLPTFGWDPLVLAPRDPHFHQAPREGGEDPSSVIRTGSLELSRLLRRRSAGSEPVSRRAQGGGGADDTLSPVIAGVGGNTVRRLVRECLYLPDAQIGWVPFALRAGGRVLEGEPTRDRIVFSSSVPYSAHLAAARLANRFRLPWVAEFRDPWSAQDPSKLPVSPFRRKLDARLEAWIIRRADRIVVTAGRTRDLLLEHFPETVPGKVAVIPNGFEPRGREEAPEPSHAGSIPPPGEPMTLVHAGTLHEPEFAVPVFEALAVLERAHPGSLRLLVYGDPQPWRRALELLGAGHPSWIELVGNVSPEDAQNAIWGASALLLPAPHRRFRPIVLGKLFSYLGSRRPILGVVPPGSEMEDLIRRAGDGRLVPEWDVDGIRLRLEALLKEHRAGRLQAPMVPEKRVAPFTRKARAGDLARVLGEALAERGRA